MARRAADLALRLHLELQLVLGLHSAPGLHLAPGLHVALPVRLALTVVPAPRARLGRLAVRGLRAERAAATRP